MKKREEHWLILLSLFIFKITIYKILLFIILHESRKESNPFLDGVYTRFNHREIAAKVTAPLKADVVFV